LKERGKKKGLILPEIKENEGGRAEKGRIHPLHKKKGDHGMNDA
jgi:hypothetical protein